MLERIVVKRTPFQEQMDWRLAEVFAEATTIASENDPARPEWPATPKVAIDPDGRGTVIVSDESQNPYGIAKARPLHEDLVDYVIEGRMLFERRRAGLLNRNIGAVMPLRTILLSAGNYANAMQQSFREKGLPPPILIMDKCTAGGRLGHISEWYADIILTDLDRELSGKDLLEAAGVEGIERTSYAGGNRVARNYDWLVHELFNLRPEYIFTPSRGIFDCVLHWQEQTAYNAAFGQQDPRLAAHPTDVVSINVVCVRPASEQSAARHISARHEPFARFKESDVKGLQALGYTGPDTQVLKVSEAYIADAHKAVQPIVQTSPTGSAGVAGILQLTDGQRLDRSKRIVAVNTGIEC